MSQESISETQVVDNDYHAMFELEARKAIQNIHRLQEEVRLIEALPLPERMLAWSECERLLRPPLTGNTINLHADA